MYIGGESDMNLKKRGWITAVLILSTLTTTSIMGVNHTKDSTINTSFISIFDDENLKIKYENTEKELNIDEEINIDSLLAEDLSIKKDNAKILIIHSHPYEKYALDLEGNQGSVIDVGNKLEEILEDKYDISVIHLSDDNMTEAYNVTEAYKTIEARVKKVLKENPSIQVIIDIHRDGGVKPTATMIKNKPTAKVNINNGLCIDAEVGTIGSLKEYTNPYIYENLSLSTQIKIRGDAMTPNLIEPITLLSNRYSLYMLPKSLMIDVGNNMDTLETAENAIESFSEILADVLKLDKLDE